MKRSIIISSLLFISCSETPRSLFPVPSDTADMATTPSADLTGYDAGSYQPTAPNILTVSPKLLSTSGGDQLTLTGGPFSPSTNFFINNQLVNVMSVTPTTAVLLTPVRPGVGPATIVARNPDGQTSKNSNAAMSQSALTLYAAQLSFAQTAYPTLAQRPHGAAFGDLNGDGRVDAIVTHLDQSVYTVFLGNGMGGFSPLQPTPTFSFLGGQVANNTTRLIDLNGDGRLDMVVGTTSSQVHYYLGNGTGLMNAVASVNYGASGNVFSQAVADINGDNQPDLITGNVNASNIGLFINTANNTNLYQAGQYMALAPNGQPTRVQTADINGDGRQDLVAVMQNNGGATLAVYFGTGQQATPFQAANPLNYGTNGANQTPQWMELGDLNNDGKIDCVVSDSVTNTIRVFIGTGSANATFNPPNNPVFVGAGPQQIAIADMNGDGNPDVIVANRVASNVSVLLGSGDGNFSSRQDFPSVNGPWAVYILDLNNDKRQDFVIVNELNSTNNANPGNMTVYLNTSQ